MIAEIAVATGTHPAPWWDEPEEMLLTVLEIFEEKRKAEEAATKRRR